MDGRTAFLTDQDGWSASATSDSPEAHGRRSGTQEVLRAPLFGVFDVMPDGSTVLISTRFYDLAAPFAVPDAREYPKQPKSLGVEGAVVFGSAFILHHLGPGLPARKRIIAQYLDCKRGSRLVTVVPRVGRSPEAPFPS